MRISGLLRAALAAVFAAAPAAAQETPSREVKELQVSLQSQEEAVRASAARILGEMGMAARPALPDLIRALEDDSRDVRQNAATSIGLVGPGDPKAVDSLIALLRDKEWQVRRAAVVSLGRLGDPRAEQALKAARKDSNKSVKDAAKRSLKELKKRKKK